MSRFREQVRKRRLALGLTQEQVAVAIGEERHNYNNFEKGRRNLNDEKIVKLASALELDPKTIAAWRVIDITTPEILAKALEEWERIRAEQEILEAAEDAVNKSTGQAKTNAQKALKQLQDDFK